MQTRTLLPNLSDTSTVKSSPLLFITERRRLTSDLEIASGVLSRAVEYLVSEQLNGRRNPVQANREAIAILCEAGRKLSQEERRKPARRSIAAWLQAAALFMANDR
jgi:hypothetical protein